MYFLMFIIYFPPGDSAAASRTIENRIYQFCVCGHYACNHNNRFDSPRMNVLCTGPHLNSPVHDNKPITVTMRLNPLRDLTVYSIHYPIVKYTFILEIKYAKQPTDVHSFDADRRHMRAVQCSLSGHRHVRAENKQLPLQKKKKKKQQLCHHYTRS